VAEVFILQVGLAEISEEGAVPRALVLEVTSVPESLIHKLIQRYINVK
jgi:hypothetical protein